MISPSKLPPRASARLPCWVRVRLPVCCRFGFLPIGRYEWRPGFARLERLTLSIERNMSSHLSLMHAATSNFLARAWMSSTCSNVSLQFYVESFKGYFVSKLVESDSLVKTSSCPLRSSCLSLASHTFGSARLQAEKAPGLWKL